MGITLAYCENCGHERDEHMFGGCNDVFSGMGVDNMDVWEEPCDCGGYMPSLDDVEDDPWV